MLVLGLVGTGIVGTGIVGTGSCLDLLNSG